MSRKQQRCEICQTPLEGPGKVCTQCAIDTVRDRTAADQPGMTIGGFFVTHDEPEETLPPHPPVKIMYDDLAAISRLSMLMGLINASLMVIKDITHSSREFYPSFVDDTLRPVIVDARTALQSSLAIISEQITQIEKRIDPMPDHVKWALDEAEEAVRNDPMRAKT